MTYQPARFEELWLLDMVRPFFTQQLITDVVSRVKGGKEASVYRCVAADGLDTNVLAANVYRPRMFRNLRQDHQYREGRGMIDMDGRAIRGNDARVLRAVNKGSAFGQQVRQSSWLSHEVLTINKLAEIGVDVPKIYASAENAVLMTFLGDALQTAPTLSETHLEEDEAKAVFDRLMHNVDLMLRAEVVHGDLSAFNVIYWRGDVTIIDFPQAVNPYINSHARRFFERDVVRLCDYFQKQGVRCDGKALAKKMWRNYYDENAPVDYELRNGE